MAITETRIHRLIGISQALAGHTDPGMAFRAAAAEIAGLICYDHIDIAIILPDRQTHVVYEVGPPTSWSDLVKNPLPTDRSPARLVLRGEAPFLLAADAQTDPRFHFAQALDQPIYEAGLRGRIIVPMRLRGGIMGTLNVSRQVADCYMMGDVEIAQVCADLLTPYIAALLHAQEARRAMRAESRARRSELYLRQGASRLTEDLDRERARLAMDLHDQTLADLARIARHVAALRAGGEARDADLADLGRLVDSCLTELRGVIDDMQPSLLGLFGICDALEAHLGKSVRHHQPAVETRVRDETGGVIDKVAEPALTALYRIAQEAINNAAHHSNAHVIAVTFQRINGGIRITVADDGCGLGKGGRLSRVGGLSHMRTRATLIGATLRTEARPEGGTQVVVDYRLPQAASEPPQGRVVALIG